MWTTSSVSWVRGGAGAEVPGEGRSTDSRWPWRLRPRVESVVLTHVGKTALNYANALTLKSLVRRTGMPNT